MSRNRFNINESEKNRIRSLHKNYLIKEQDIDVEIDPVVVDPAPPVDDPDNPILQADDGKTKYTTTTTTQPSGIPCHNI